MRQFMDGIRQADVERRAEIGRRDLSRAEHRIRQELTEQICRLVKTGVLAVDATEYERLLDSAAPQDWQGPAEQIETRACQVRSWPSWDMSPRNVFTGTRIADIDSDAGSRYIAQIRDLPREPRDSFLSHIEPDELQRRFLEVGELFAPASSRQCLSVWARLGEDAGHVAALLLAMCSIPSSRPTSPPSEAWWTIWRDATASLHPALVRSLCEELWRIPSEPDVKFDPLGQTVTRAALWGVSAVATPNTVEEIARLAERQMQRGGEGETLTLVAIRALGRIGIDEALDQLHYLARRTKNKPYSRAINAELEGAARARGIDVAALEDLAVEIFGLDRTGVRTWAMGEYEASIALNLRGRVDIRYRHPSSERSWPSPPKPIKEGWPDTLAAIRGAVKRLREAVTLQAGRLEEAMVEGRPVTLSEWNRTYGSNPVLWNLATRLVWEVWEGASVVHARPTRDGWVDAQGRPLVVSPAATLKVNHPVLLPHEVREAWRHHIVRREIVQPFKQVYREVYVPTPAEAGTLIYSNRFAAQVVRHPQVYALIRARGWSGLGYLAVDADLTAHRDYPRHRLRAVLEASDVGGPTWGGQKTATVDRVWFCRVERRGTRWVPVSGELPLAQVSPVVFSEAMRDVDLFVSVAGIGTDVNWEEWEVRRGRQVESWVEARQRYETLQAASADQRAVVLADLLPALGLGDSLQLDGRWVMVRGKRHRYRIHLGSGNIHIEPEGRYLCIVPARRKLESLYVPFEETDFKTAEILSKILLLASDEKIQDSTILRQL